MTDTTESSRLSQRIQAEMVDSFDEELEMEIDDERLARVLGELAIGLTRRPSTGSSTSRSSSGCRASS